MSLFGKIQSLHSNVLSLGVFYLAWCTAHHIAPYFYIYFCTPYTLWGIIISPFMVAAPHCTGLRWVIYEGGNTINAMWISFAVYITSKNIFYKP